MKLTEVTLIAHRPGTGPAPGAMVALSPLPPPDRGIVPGW
ncbi:hypothetical protein SNL152K_2873 [Streptomyces sp. NL15-2K]|nr:hypothetical protein SNL152K_2873 [Streptomyces sp. NL15-2K]